MCVFIQFYKNYLYRPTTKFYCNLFFLKYSPSGGIVYTLIPNFLIETEKTLKIKKLQEINIINFYNKTILILYIVILFDLCYLLFKLNVSLFI